MYINLIPNKQLRKTKQSMLALGIFLTGGCAYAILRELLLRAQFRPDWLVAAGGLLVVGVVVLALGAGWIHLKDTFFSMNPERISYRLTHYGREHVLYWQAVQSIGITQSGVVFELKDGELVTLRLGVVQDEAIARHIEASVRLAALEQNVSINGVQLHKEKAG